MDEQHTSGENAFPSAQKNEQIAGPIIGGIILLLTIIAAVYFWMGNDIGDPTPINASTPNPTRSVPQADTAVAELSAQGTSDEIADIEADLSATNLDSLGEFMGEIE
jgi:hypothetical protein